MEYIEWATYACVMRYGMIIGLERNLNIATNSEMQYGRWFETCYVYRKFNNTAKFGDEK
jgi:hypothetical protein